MQEIIIADTSCLILLSKINELHLLQKLYGHITITSIIAQEYAHPVPEWINVKDADNLAALPLLQITVDAGEASAIALALEQSKCLLILDDIKARKLALKLKLVYTGTLGILLEAKNRGCIKSIKPVLQQIKLTNFYLPIELEQKVLVLAGEHDI